MIQAVLADDEVLARQKLRQLLRDERDIEIVGECASATETVELVRAAKPELLFLDIRMPGMDGFDVIGTLSCEIGLPMPSIIFTTAYDQYALRAFEVHAVDYLLKPFTPADCIPRFSAFENARLQRPLRQIQTVKTEMLSDLPRVLSLSLVDESSSFQLQTFDGSAPKRTMSAYAPVRRPTSCERQCRAWKEDWTRKCSSVFTARLSSI